MHRIHDLESAPSDVHELWLKWMHSNLRVIPVAYRPKNDVVVIWRTIIYDELCNYCEAVEMSEDLLLETFASYKRFQITWREFLLEEDPEILRRTTRDITFRTKGISKRKVRLIFVLHAHTSSHRTPIYPGQGSSRKD